MDDDGEHLLLQPRDLTVKANKQTLRSHVSCQLLYISAQPQNRQRVPAAVRLEAAVLDASSECSLRRPCKTLQVLYFSIPGIFYMERIHTVPILVCFKEQMAGSEHFCGAAGCRVSQLWISHLCACSQPCWTVSWLHSRPQMRSCGHCSWQQLLVSPLQPRWKRASCPLTLQSCRREACLCFHVDSAHLCVVPAE